MSAHGLIDYRRRIRSDRADLRGLGAIESNIDKNFANRMKKRGMSWSESGAHHMAKVIQARFNGRLDEAVALSRPQEPKTKRMRPALQRIKSDFTKDQRSLALRQNARSHWPPQLPALGKSTKELSEAKLLAAHL